MKNPDRTHRTTGAFRNHVQQRDSTGAAQKTGSEDEIAAIIRASLALEPHLAEAAVQMMRALSQPGDEARCVSCRKLKPTGGRWTVGAFLPKHPGWPRLAYALCPQCAGDPAAIARGARGMDTTARDLFERKGAPA